MLKIRVYFDDESWLGPGKVRLLELIAEHGSISAAGRAMDMSYKRAWDLVAELNRIFGAPVAETQSGGRSGGGAVVTDLGRSVIVLYRAIEAEAAESTATDVDALERLRRAAPAQAKSAENPTADPGEPPPGVPPRAGRRRPSAPRRGSATARR
jgi:molybdate transport system regulatory protein